MQSHGQLPIARCRTLCQLGPRPRQRKSRRHRDRGPARGPAGSSRTGPLMKDNEITISMLSRAKSAGFTTLVVTLNLWALSWRPKDLDNASVPFYLGIGDAICLSDPVFQKKWKDGPGKGKSIQDDFQNACMGWEKTVFSGHSHTWEDIKFLKEHWDGPIVLKGLPCCFIY